MVVGLSKEITGGRYSIGPGLICHISCTEPHRITGQ